MGKLIAKIRMWFGPGKNG